LHATVRILGSAAILTLVQQLSATIRWHTGRFQPFRHTVAVRAGQAISKTQLAA
jgi:hypothetical protein